MTALPQARPGTLDSVLDRIGRGVLGVLRWLAYCLGTLWAAGAVYVDGPLGMLTGNAWLALGWLIVAVLCLALARTRWWRTLLWSACFVAVLLPWLAIAPSNDREWKPDWAETGRADLDGQHLTFYNFRNFDYGADGAVVERWVTRRVRLSQLRGVDYFHVAFGGDFIAHPILSFDFGDDGHVALSVETRREVGESFSQIGGFYKMFELQYVFGDERDLVRVRTNLRDEPVFLYRSALSREQALFILLDSIRELDLLHEQPRFYNVIGANCTTSLLTQTVELRNAPFDMRMVANGRFDALIFERGGFSVDSDDFAVVRERASINAAAQAAHGAADFSARIRAGRPGFD